MFSFFKRTRGHDRFVLNRMHRVFMGFVLAIAALAAAAPAGAESSAGAAASFTWSVPPRYGQTQVAAGPHLIMGETNTPAYGRVSTVAVTLDACRSTSAVQYMWSGASVGRIPLPRRIVKPGYADDGKDDGDEVRFDPCRFRTSIPNGQSRTVTLRVKDRAGNVSKAFTQEIRPRDYLIAVLGDSASAGEGLPPIRQEFGPLGDFMRPAYWKNRHCHRSPHAPGAVAARVVENADSRSAVTFIHLACSGAHIGTGLVERYDGIECCQNVDRLPNFGQLRELKEIVGDRQIGALVLSVGINDLGFSDVIFNCALPFNQCDESQESRIRTNLDALWYGNGGLYAHLRDEIANVGLNVRPSSVYLVEYPDPSTNEFGQQVRLPDVLVAVNEDEIAWMGSVARRLNERLHMAASALGWQVVDGIATGFYGHGMTAGAQRWINTPRDSLTIQGPWPRACLNDGAPLGFLPTAASNFAPTWLSSVYMLACGAAKVVWQVAPTGTFHPNAQGYAFMGQRVIDRLLNGATATASLNAESLHAGERAAATVTLQNMSMFTWDPGTYVLRPTGRTGPTWGVGALALPRPIAPGEQLTFTFDVTAPTEPGPYQLGWQLSRGGTAFGPGASVEVEVLPSKDEPPCVTLQRELTRTLSAINGLELELAHLDSGAPDWKREQFRINTELRGLRAKLKTIQAAFAKGGCK